MSSQIFKNPIPSQLLIKLLNDIAIKTDKCYVLNNNAYKKGMFNDIIINFIEECKPYYYLSKRKYLEKKQVTGNKLGLTTLAGEQGLRQLM